MPGVQVPMQSVSCSQRATRLCSVGHSTIFCSIQILNACRHHAKQDSKCMRCPAEQVQLFCKVIKILITLYDAKAANMRLLFLPILFFGPTLLLATAAAGVGIEHFDWRFIEQLRREQDGSAIQAMETGSTIPYFKILSYSSKIPTLQDNSACSCFALLM